MARPTKYKKEYIKKVDEYLEINQDENIQNKLKVNLPTIGGFALFIKVPESTLYDWRKEHDEFSESLEKIVKEQQKRLINSGLSGDYNSTIAKLILSSNHGMSEKTETDITTQGESLNKNKDIDEMSDKAIKDYLNGRNSNIKKQ